MTGRRGPEMYGHTPDQAHSCRPIVDDIIHVLAGVKIEVVVCIQHQLGNSRSVLQDIVAESIGFVCLLTRSRSRPECGAVMSCSILENGSVHVRTVRSGSSTRNGAW